jgi:hypothetical protein
MNKLHLFCYVDKDSRKAYRDLIEYKAEMERLHPCEFTIVEFDSTDLSFETRNRKIYATDASVFKFTEPVYKKYGKKVDAVKFFIDKKNWKQGEIRLNGYKLGRIFHGYYVTFTHYRRDYEQTAEHELLHLVDEYTYENTGVRFETVFGIKDFDQDIVHSQKYWKDEHYNYDEVWKVISPYVTNATFKRRNNEEVQIIKLLQTVVRLLQQLKLLQYESHSIPAIEFKKMHVDKCYDTVQEIANIGHIDLGTERGTVNEIVNSTKTASYNWYIPRHAEYVIEFVPRGKASWHAGRISNPTDLATKLFGGKNKLVDSGEPNNLGYGICYEGLTVDTEPTKAQVELCAELIKYLKLEDKPFIEHWQVTDYKPRIVTKFVERVNELLK